MAFIVIAGMCDCPLYAVAEAVADHMNALLPCFKVHKIVKDKDEWPSWLRDTCRKNGWIHFRSPIVWRELIQRGGRGILIGGASDFLQYASAYYGVTVKLTTNESLKLAAENQRLFIKQNHLIRYGATEHPAPLFRVCVTNACQPMAIFIMGELISRRALGEDKTISLNLVCHPDHEDILTSMRDDLFDMGSPILREVNIALDFESAVKDCSLVIWLEEAPRGLPVAWPSQTPTWKVVGSMSESDSSAVGEDMKEELVSGRPRPKKDETVEEGSEFTNETDASEFPLQSEISATTETYDSEKDENVSSEVTEREAGTSHRSWLKMTKSELVVERNYERYLERQQGHTPDYSGEAGLPKSKTATVAISSDWNVKESRSSAISTTGPPRTRTAPSVLLEQALRIRVQGNVLRGVAKPDCKVLMMGTGNLNYNAFILSMTAKLPTGNIIAVDDAENRTRAVLAKKMGLKAPEILDIAIWGDPTGSFQVDVFRAMTDCFNGAIWKEKGFRREFATMFHDWKWFRRELKDDMSAARDKLYTLKGNHPIVLPICHRAATVLQKWYAPKIDMKTSFSIGVISDGLYDIPPGCVVTCPVYLGNGTWIPIPDLELPPSLSTKVQRSIQKCTHTQVLYKLRFLQEDAQFELDASSHEDEEDFSDGLHQHRDRSNSLALSSQVSYDDDEDSFQ